MVGIDPREKTFFCLYPTKNIQHTNLVKRGNVQNSPTLLARLTEQD